MKKNSSVIKFIYILICAVCPVMILSICLFFRNMLPGQSEAIVAGDYIHEYLPFFVHFWHRLIHGESIQYSFSLGMGSPTLAMYSIFVVSPFSIIPYLVSDISLAGYIMWMLKTSVISLSMVYFLIKDLKCKKSTALVFSLFYSLSSYIVIWYNNIHFIDILYILPLLIHFILVFVKENKRIGLILLYTFSFINNLFMGYCTGLFSFLVYILLIWYFRTPREQIIKSLFNYIKAVIIAVLLSCPVILPTIMFVLQHMTEGSDFLIMQIKDPVYLLNSLMFGRKMQGIFDTMPALYCGWPTLLFVLIFFFGKNDKRKKLFAGILVLFQIVCIFWHPAYLFMHMFNEPDSFPWRFTFITAFVMVCIAAYEFDQYHETFFSAAHIIPLFMTVTIVGYAYYSNCMEFMENGLIPLYVVLLNLLIIFTHFLVDKKRICMFCLSVFELFIAVYLQLPFRQYTQEGINNGHKQLDELVAANMTDNTDFNRINLFNSFCINAPLLYDYNGMDYFCSFDNNTLNNALKLLGLYGRPQQYNNYGNTEFTNMILCVKSMGVNDNNKVYTYDNTLVLPLAFSVTEDIKSITVTDNPFENQQSLADGMTINDKRLYYTMDPQVTVNDGAELYIDDEGVYHFIKTGENGMGIWYAEKNNTKAQYIFISDGLRASGMGDTEKIIEGKPISASLPLSIPVISRFFTSDDKTSQVVCLSLGGDIGSEVTINTAIARSMDMEALSSVYDELAPLGIEIDSFRDDRIHGHIVSDNEHRVLFSSIPYDINWHIMIDGQECDTYPVFNGAFLACDITPGEHEVEYIYKDSSLTMGLGAFCVGLLLLLLQIKKDNMNARSENEFSDLKSSDTLFIDENTRDI